ncbi:hypothetical protein LUZ60_009161 [Juncus effusus]|nr:hypothetical protein LUZ60_009161 [Juncus effusus]
MEARDELKSALLSKGVMIRRIWLFSISSLLIVIVLLLSVLVIITGINNTKITLASHHHDHKLELKSTEGPEIVKSKIGVVAADDGRCSEIGANMLKAGGHAVDAAVAATLCLGVVHPVSSGLGGGAFIILRQSESGESLAIDARETAPLAATKDMYKNNPSSKFEGGLSAGVPGELAGLHAAWLRYGRLPWRDLFLPSIKLAKEGFSIIPFLANAMQAHKDLILADPGLHEVLAPHGKLLLANETCYNPKLGDTLEEIANKGPDVFYSGSIGENFVRDVNNSGGIITMEDMREYKVKISKAMEVDEIWGYKLLGMPPPSSGTVSLALVMNILQSYKSMDAVKGLLGLHRFIEAMKHMFAIRMNLGDPDFVNISLDVSNMLSRSFAAKIRQKIVDNTTFSPDYYMPKYSQLRDHGTSHLCVVDSERNAVSMTTTINDYFGAGVLSPSTGIVINNEMDDFSNPYDVTPDDLPPAPTNFIQPRKRPLSSMTPLIILKENQLVGVVGGSGGMKIIPAVMQVFLNHFIFGMKPLASIQKSRVYHKLIPNRVEYENYTAIDGEKIEFRNSEKIFLEQRGHELKSISAGAVCQLVVHEFTVPVSDSSTVYKGMLTAVSDPRKDGAPAGL